MTRSGWYVIGDFKISTGVKGKSYMAISAHTKKEIDSAKNKIRYKIKKEYPLRTASFEFYTKYF